MGTNRQAMSPELEKKIKVLGLFEASDNDPRQFFEPLRLDAEIKLKARMPWALGEIGLGRALRSPPKKELELQDAPAAPAAPAAPVTKELTAEERQSHGGALDARGCQWWVMVSHLRAS
eukprot:Skav215506  [mRNA]  locus=scaffold165:997536:1000423:- [translate_table: standard]